MNYTNLYKWGLTEVFLETAQKNPEMILARVTEQHRNIYKVAWENGIISAQVSGKFLYNTENNSDFPAVGDWVLLDSEEEPAIIQAILPRKSAFARKAAGTAGGIQIVAANIDTIFICMAMNSDFNLRRMERYLALGWDSGAVPVIVLTKADLCSSTEEYIQMVEGISFGTDILVCSSEAGLGYDAISSYITPEKTIAFIGSSGVGKSTMINYLLGENVFATNVIREDGRGKHTTTHRQLIALPQGGIVIDTPGMRELGADSADLEKSFADIETLSESCRFSDCTHTTEPGCAVIAAIEKGELDPKRLANYKKIQVEAGYDGLTSKQVEEEKIKRMFGGKSEMKQVMREIKKRNKQR